MFKRYLFLFGIIIAASLSANATLRQHSLRRNVNMKAHSMQLRQYSDSLKALNDRIYSYSYNDSLARPDDGMAKLFLPLTFYHDISRRAFSLGDTLSESDKHLLNIYIHHPELVKTTETRLRKAGIPDDEPGAPLVWHPSFVEKADAKPVEPESAPVALVLRHPNFWTYKGDYSLQFMQNYISNNWYKGGESNYSTLATVTMEANYNNKQKVKWDNKLELRFGLQSAKSDTVHNFKTTEDLFRITSKLGLQASKKWYYTLQFLAYSQFARGYKANKTTIYSDFLAPLNLNVSLGMDYTVDVLKHKLTGTVHLAPLAYNMKYTRRLDLSERLGIDEGHHFLNDFGSEFTVDLKWQIIEMLQWKTRLYGYTSYERAELEWENTFTLKFNRWISAQLFVYPRFDDGVARDGHHGYWQFKEYASIGFQYSF